MYIYAHTYIHRQSVSCWDNRSSSEFKNLLLFNVSEIYWSMLRYSVDSLTVRTNKRILNRDFPATGCCIRAQKYYKKNLLLFWRVSQWKIKLNSKKFNYFELKFLNYNLVFWIISNIIGQNSAKIFFFK